MSELYLYSLIRLYGVVLNQLSPGLNLLHHKTKVSCTLYTTDPLPVLVVLSIFTTAGEFITL
jgi:hypothetical protein